MIPDQMIVFLRERLPQQTFDNRLIKDNGKCFLEFGILDVERLSRLGIQVDNLGPRLVVAMWMNLHLWKLVVTWLSITWPWVNRRWGVSACFPM